MARPLEMAVGGATGIELLLHGVEDRLVDDRFVATIACVGPVGEAADVDRVASSRRVPRSGPDFAKRRLQ